VCLNFVFFLSPQILTQADTLRGKSESTAFAQSQLDRAMYREISSIWQSDEVSRSKPTPQMEAERGTLVAENVLWEALPSYLRKLSTTMESTLGKKLPLDAAPVIFSSWMGGDRDGNPNVTPSVTREVILKQRAQAAGLYARDLRKLERELSIQECSEELRAQVCDAPEPYRAMIWPVSFFKENIGFGVPKENSVPVARFCRAYISPLIVATPFFSINV